MNTKNLNQIFFLLVISLCSFGIKSETVDNEVSLLVHKTPTCGCCKMWIKHLEENGFAPSVKDHNSLQEIKESYDIKPKYRSCHTGVSKDGYIFEGHIPSKYITQFISESIQMQLVYLFPGCHLDHPEWKSMACLRHIMF